MAAGDNFEFVVFCAACGNQTPVCESLREAVSLWHQIYCGVLPPNETAHA
jgi:hypothetical protein